MRFMALGMALVIGTAWGQGVTFDRLLHADREPQNWLSYSRTIDGERYSPLAQITPANVKNLELQWVWQQKSVEKFEATPLVVDGIMYTVQAPNDVYALDAVTGRVFWTTPYNNDPGARVCCGRVNRGLAILGDTLYMGTLDAHVLAIDAKTGKIIWNSVAGKFEDRLAITHAPLIVKDKVILGMAGGDGPIRSYVIAFDAKTGKEAWRFYTIPGEGEPGHETWLGDSWKTGGAAIWNTGAYDPDTNLTFWGTGNPAPDTNGDVRLGDNLFSDSVLALDADTGKLKWYYQFTPHDTLDYDSTQVPVLADIQYQGRARKVMLWANRNGLFYVLDRTSGEFLMGKPFVKANWLTGFDEKGRPMRVPGQQESEVPVLVQPYGLGGTNWYPPSYSPHTGLFIIPGWENSGSMVSKTNGFGRSTGDTPMAQPNLIPNRKTEAEGYGIVRAFDPKTGERKWEYKMNDITWAGVLSTGSDLVFSGGKEGYFYALDGTNGKLLWKQNLGGQVNSGPMSYMVNNRQYVAVAAGSALFVYALRQQ
ncbi:MAG TPA: PQQ-dependent dehydrogenase, methanol/ethanol family [Bryobacteraceae bacterium]|jgi:alcohol dehydrogenase (cytochrome c)